MCAPIVLPDAAIGLVAAHILGIGLIAGIVVFNSNGVRKSMSSLLGLPGMIVHTGEGISSRMLR
ncbi:MAG: hypothetical protein LUQ71_05760 [Methanoregula sp.]|nr:hypothetical protein [Methanoregula sp.]